MKHGERLSREQPSAEVRPAAFHQKRLSLACPAAGASARAGQLSGCVVRAPPPLPVQEACGHGSARCPRLQQALFHPAPGLLRLEGRRQLSGSCCFSPPRSHWLPAATRRTLVPALPSPSISSHRDQRRSHHPGGRSPSSISTGDCEASSCLTGCLPSLPVKK
ncbi:hypothetical protein NDU88_005976 [Pleurodeles waltl]|uniref:Uncharacterized protein n=1 Tax=Pleurodeles waltl TaxID=8319 RepID=A0AAV7WC29_PLEWA|nr:hypothetical protein NDU88_005976 [Pleurodeles waltl]